MLENKTKISYMVPEVGLPFSLKAFCFSRKLDTKPAKKRQMLIADWKRGIAIAALILSAAPAMATEGWEPPSKPEPQRERPSERSDGGPQAPRQKPKVCVGMVDGKPVTFLIGGADRGAVPQSQLPRCEGYFHTGKWWGM